MNKNFVSIFVLFLSVIVMTTMAFAIVPPRVPGLTLPAEMLENIQQDPNYYTPGVALSQRIQLYRQQKLSAQRGEAKEPDPVVGYLPVLCMQYADVDSEWPISQMENQLFDTNAEWPTGSMTDYYEEISYGAFSVTGDVFGWIQMSENSEYYDRDNGHTYELITEALTITDPDIDFSLYDNDGPDGVPNSGDDDGYVDELVLIHSGTGGEYGGPEIWSHSWTLQAAGGAYSTDDASENGGNIIINGYVIQPAVTSNNQMEEIGVFCHEYGHALGLPDLYDRTPSGGSDSEGVGNWALMAGGGSDGSRPSHMCPWSKEIMGWVTPIVLTQNWYDHPIPAVEDTALVYKLWTHGNIEPYDFGGIWGNWSVNAGREYFLIENRQKKKFDDQLPGAGLLIWHIRNDVTTQNDDVLNKMVDLETADNRYDMDQGKNRGDDGDPYPGSYNNRNFDRTTQPDSDIHEGGFSKVAVRNISDSADTMYADLFVVATDLMYSTNYLFDETGNDNGYADPGETVDLRLEFLNLGADIPWFEMTLSTSDPDVTIIDSLAVLSNIGEDSLFRNETDLFQFSVSDGADYHPIRFELYGSDGADYEEYLSFIVMMENLAVLLVDDTGGQTDDDGRMIIFYYEDALNAAEITYYSKWVNYVQGPPELAGISDYRTVVWVTGSVTETLNSEEQSLLQSYLDNGGSVLITGQNIGYDLVELGSADDSTFYANYLRAGYEADDPGIGTNILMKGIDGDKISHSYQPYFFISGGNSANNQVSPDIIVPINGAEGTFEYFGTGLMGKSSAIKYSGDYRLVYMSFGIEGINELHTRPIYRYDVLRRIIGWLQEDPGILTISEERIETIPQKFFLYPNYPNPFNPETSIMFSLDITSPIEVKIYSILGQEISTLHSGILESGYHSMVWNGTDQFGKSVGSGVYIYRIVSGNRALTGKMMLLK